MTKRRLRRGPNGRFINRQMPRKNGSKKEPKAQAKSIIIHESRIGGKTAAMNAVKKEAEREGKKVLVIKPETTDRPACFGNCYELSSACNACQSFNSCRRSS